MRLDPAKHQAGPSLLFLRGLGEWSARPAVRYSPLPKTLRNLPSQVPDSTAPKSAGFTLPETGVIGRRWALGRPAHVRTLWWSTVATELLGDGARFGEVADILGNSPEIVSKHCTKCPYPDGYAL